MLYIIPTPIGNLKDITLRAIEILKSVDLILAEDTRNTIKLLNHYQIICPLTPFHQHNEHQVFNILPINYCRVKKWPWYQMPVPRNFGSCFSIGS